MRIALAMIVKPTDDEAGLLYRCLHSIAPHVDGLFITVTGENKKCDDVIKEFGGNVFRYEWDKNFARARNFSFAQVPKEYDFIVWCDADDVWRGAEKIKETIAQAPSSDVFSLNYLYHFDEYRHPDVVHIKTRIVRNDGCVEWAGELHEDFKENRRVSGYFVEGIDVLHLTDDARVSVAAARNLDIAEVAWKGDDTDPRRWWNYANTLRGAGKMQESIDVFTEFIKRSSSDEEKFIAWQRISEANMALGKWSAAIDAGRMTIAFMPSRPDGYHLCGHVFHGMGQYSKAIEMFKEGLRHKPEPHKTIVYNPRDYDFVPLSMMARCYTLMSLPPLALECLRTCLKIKPNDKGLKKMIAMIEKESERFERVAKQVKKLSTLKDDETLRRRLEKLPEDMVAHPAICNLRNTRLVRNETSGKEIVFFCGFTTDEWTPEIARTKGIGGSEEAVINLSRELAARGWDVTVFNNCGYKPFVADGVKYKPFWMWNYRDKHDILVLWRQFQALGYDINAKKIYVDLHDVVSEGEFTEQRMEKITKVFVKSQAHRDLFPKVTDEKIVVVPNGLAVGLFSEPVVRDPNLIVNTSSPDRSLEALLDCFARIKEQVPEAKCRWAYGWGVYDSAFADNPERIDWKKKMVDRIAATPGFEALGRIGHEDVAKLYLEGSVFAYPTEFYEIDCISARKAQLAGCWPVTTDFAALSTTVQYGDKIHSDKTKDDWAEGRTQFSLESQAARDEFVAKAVDRLKNPPYAEEREEMMEWAKTFSWSAIADVWDKEMNIWER